MGVVKKENNSICIQEGDKWRTVGELEGTETIILKVFRDRSKHLMKVWNAYGFAKDVIDRNDWFEYLYLTEKNGSEESKYFIPRADIVLEGRLYQTEGFERQYFLPLTIIERYKQ